MNLTHKNTWLLRCLVFFFTMAVTQTTATFPETTKSISKYIKWHIFKNLNVMSSIVLRKCPTRNSLRTGGITSSWPSFSRKNVKTHEARLVASCTCTAVKRGNCLLGLGRPHTDIAFVNLFGFTRLENVWNPSERQHFGHPCRDAEPPLLSTGSRHSRPANDTGNTARFGRKSRSTMGAAQLPRKLP